MPTCSAKTNIHTHTHIHTHPHTHSHHCHGCFYGAPIWACDVRLLPHHASTFVAVVFEFPLSCWNMCMCVLVRILIFQSVRLPPHHASPFVAVVFGFPISYWNRFMCALVRILIFRSLRHPPHPYVNIVAVGFDFQYQIDIRHILRTMIYYEWWQFNIRIIRRHLFLLGSYDMLYYFVVYVASRCCWFWFPWSYWYTTYTTKYKILRHITIWYTHHTSTFVPVGFIFHSYIDTRHIVLFRSICCLPLLMVWFALSNWYTT